MVGDLSNTGMENAEACLLGASNMWALAVVGKLPAHELVMAAEDPRIRVFASPGSGLACAGDVDVAGLTW
jgi:hypothetical protein